MANGQSSCVVGLNEDQPITMQPEQIIRYIRFNGQHRSTTRIIRLDKPFRGPSATKVSEFASR